MLEAILWGIIQGLTEFLPISSSGHLVLVPEILGLEPPDLATSAVLHLGTLGAVLGYFRTEVVEILRLSDSGKQLLRLLVIGSIPAGLLALLFEARLEELQDTPRAVALALFLAGLVFFATRWIGRGARTLRDLGDRDALTIGVSQAIALIPGVSRSGATISVGLVRSVDRRDAARFSFLLGIPAIAAAGLKGLYDIADSGAGMSADLGVAVIVAAAAGYVAIAGLLRLIRTTGLAPFGVYCMAAGALAFTLV